MKIWFDTEFYEDGSRINLISLGAVREDGAEYYVETETAHEHASSSDWLIKNVRPHLMGRAAERTMPQIRKDLIEFAGVKPEFWAYYGAYDWVAICQIFGTMMDLPKGWPMYVRDVKQLCDSFGNPKLPDQDGYEHEALGDAKWTKVAYQFLIDHHDF